jgi:hypothetical protein
VRTRGSKSRRKTSLQNCQILENLLRNITNFSSRNLIFLNGFPTFFNGFLLSSMAFRFFQQLSAFFNGFLLSSMAFHFLQWLSAFFNGFPLSSTAFRFLQWLSVEGGFSFPFLFLIKKYQIIRSHINGNSIALRGSTYAVAY